MLKMDDYVNTHRLKILRNKFHGFLEHPQNFIPENSFYFLCTIFMLTCDKLGTCYMAIGYRFLLYTGACHHCIYKHQYGYLFMISIQLVSVVWTVWHHKYFQSFMAA